MGGFNIGKILPKTVCHVNLAFRSVKHGFIGMLTETGP